MAKFAENFGSSGWVDAHDRHTEVNLQNLDLLREGPKSAYRLATGLSSSGEVLGTAAVRERLRALASRGLVADYRIRDASQQGPVDASAALLHQHFCELHQPDVQRFLICDHLGTMFSERPPGT